MANQGAVSLDTVMVNIESNAGHATSNIDKLAVSLGNLKTAINGIRPSNLKNLAAYIDNLKTSSDGLNKAMKKLSALNKLTDLSKSLDSIKSPKGFKDLVDNIAKLPNIMGKIDTNTLENVGRVSSELANKLKPLADALKNIAEGYSAISKLARNYNVSIKSLTGGTQKQIDVNKALSNTWSGIKKGMSTIGKTTLSVFTAGTKVVKTFEKPITKATSKIKQMGFALLSVRSAFTFVRKAVSEYLALDTELQKSFTNTWRAMGAQLAPALEYVQYLFHQFVRVIYSVIYALTGIDLIARANEKAMKGWGKSAKDTLGNLQKFDDLHVVEFKDTSGGDNQLIDMGKIDLSPIQKIVDYIKWLKQTIEEALDTGKWRAVGEVLGEGLTWAMATLYGNFDKIYAIAMNISKELASGISGFIDATDFTLVAQNLGNAIITFKDAVANFFNGFKGADLAKKIDEFVEGFPAEAMMKSMINVPISILNLIYETVINMDWGAVGSKIGNAVLTGLQTFRDWLKTIDFTELGKKITQFIANIPWGSIFATLWDILIESLSGIGETVAGIVFGEDFGSTAKSALQGWGVILGVLLGGILLKKLGSLIGDWISGKLSSLFTSKTGKGKAGDLTQSEKGLDSFLKSAGKATEIIAVLGGLALVITTITTLLKEFAETGMSSGEALKLIGGILGEIAIGFAAMAGATKLLNADDFLTILAMLGGLSAVLLSLSVVLNACVSLGDNIDSVFKGLNKTLTTLTVFMAALVASALILGSDPLALIGVLAITGALSLILITMADTLPTILDAVSKFITETAPSLQSILDTINQGITNIIHALGDTLPPIIESIGNVFDKIFSGISKVISTVGDTIVNIMNTADRLVRDVLSSILMFINELGPAINTFVDNAIAAVTKLINFMISGVEYLINTLIVDSINGLLAHVKENKIAELLGFDKKIKYLGDVSIRRFVPKLETGTNEIPYEGIYHLHPGEAVVPKKYNPALGNGANDETNQKLDTLIDIMNNMSFTNVVNVGNETLYKKQQQYNKMQQNKYGTINL